MNTDKYSALIESILYCENDIVTPDRLVKLTGLSFDAIKDIMDRLIEEYNKEVHGLMIVEVADGYSFKIKKEILPFIKEFYKLKSQNKLSRSILTVLSIIAYKQPITKNEIDLIRGVSSDNAIKRLMEFNYIQIVGRKDVVGKPLLYEDHSGLPEIFQSEKYKRSSKDRRDKKR